MYKSNSSIIALFLVLLLPSCILSPSLTSNYKIEKDNVKSTRRVTTNFSYDHDQERDTPFFHQSQSILKESNSMGVTYTVFEQLELSNESFAVDKVIYWIVDETSYPIEPQMVVESQTSRKEERSNILKSDSTEVSVITGYIERNSKVTKLSYYLPNELIQSVRNSDHVAIRYYSGPSMITCKMNKSQIKRLKKFISL